MRILFCNISYLPYYNTKLDKVLPKNGGAYVAEMNDALEKYNFEVCADGKCRGFVETKHRTGYKDGIANNIYNSLHIERIAPFAKNSASIGNVLVVFCAKPDNRHNVIVGWYKNATVYRRRPSYNGRNFNIEAAKSDCFLLPENERRFRVPRAKQDGFGFGQANVWYAQEAASADYVAEVLRYIDAHSAGCD